MKRLWMSLLLVLIALQAANGELIHLTLSKNFYRTGVADTLSSHGDTILVSLPPDLHTVRMGIYVMMETLEGAGNGLILEQMPLPGGIVSLLVYDSTMSADSGKQKFLDTIAVHSDTALGGIKPIPIALRDSTGTANDTLDWVDNMWHSSYVEIASQSTSPDEFSEIPAEEIAFFAHLQADRRALMRFVVVCLPY